jgi:ribosomal protein L7/L12
MVQKKIDQILEDIKNLKMGEFIQFVESFKNAFGISPEMLNNMTNSSSNTNSATNNVPAIDLNKKVSIVLKSLGNTSILDYNKLLKPIITLTVAQLKEHKVLSEEKKEIIIISDIIYTEAQNILTQLKEKQKEQSNASDLIFEIK